MVGVSKTSYCSNRAAAWRVTVLRTSSAATKSTADTVCPYW